LSVIGCFFRGLNISVTLGYMFIMFLTTVNIVPPVYAQLNLL